MPKTTEKLTLKGQMTFSPRKNERHPEWEQVQQIPIERLPLRKKGTL